MPTVLSSSLRHKNIDNFKKTIQDESVYFFTSKPTPWSSGDLLPPSVYDSFTLEVDAYDEMLYLKRLSISNVSNVIRLYHWQENRRFQEYDNTVDLSDLLTKRTVSSNEYYPFYVVTDSYRVYKCLDNNGGELSTVEPTTSALTGSDTYTPLSDGYIWKYMYTLKPLDAVEFLTNDWFPIRTLTEDDFSENWDIITNSVNGGVYSIKVINSGSGYINILPTSGDTTSGQDGFTFTKSSDTSIVIASGMGASGTNDVYNGSFLYTKNISGVISEVAEITDYDGTSRTLTLASPGIVNVATGFEGYISPKISFTGDGTNLKAVCRMTNSNSIGKIQIFNPGMNYSECTGVITGGGGTSGAVRVIISPFGGHGYDPVVELGGFNLMTKINFEGDEGGVIVSTNEYRKIGIIANPLINGSLKLAQARSGLTTNQIRLNTTDSAVDDIHNGKKIFINSGRGRQQLRIVTDYVGSTKVLTVNDPFDILPDETSYYGFLATDTVINQCLVLNYTPGSKSSSVQYTSDALITQSGTSASGNVVFDDTLNGKIYITNITGTFNTTIVSSNAVTVTPTSIQAGTPGVQKNTGNVYYLENRTPLSRYSEQIEDIRVIIQF
jgi:hypothetical protein